jgi:hypothetical protein
VAAESCRVSCIREMTGACPCHREEYHSDENGVLSDDGNVTHDGESVQQLREDREAGLTKPSLNRFCGPDSSRQPRATFAESGVAMCSFRLGNLGTSYEPARIMPS